MNFPIHLRRIPAFREKPVPPTECIQLSYYATDGHTLWNYLGEPLMQGSWDEILDATGVWPMQNEQQVVDIARYHQQFQGKLTDERQYAEQVAVVVQEFKLIDQQSYDLAAECVRDIKARKKAFEEERARATKPLREALQVIYDWWGFLKLYDEAEQVLKKLMVSYEQRQRAERDRAHEIAGQAGMQGDVVQAAAAMRVAAQAETSRPAGIQFRDNWKYEITDIRQVPPQYLMTVVNDFAVSESIKQGARQIPGIRIYNEPIVASRRV